MSGTNRRLALVITLVVIAAGAFFGPDVWNAMRPSEPPPFTTLSIGDRVPALFILDDTEKLERIEITADGKPVVVWFWSVLCGCVSDCEQRIRTLLDRYEGKDVVFVAIDSNPNDTRFEIEELRRKLGSPYPVRRDYHGATAISLGVTASASVAVLDGDGRLRYRGAIDDDLRKPTVSYVHRALDGILSNETFEPQEAPPYGCLYPYDARSP